MGVGFALAESLSGNFYRHDDPLHDRAMSVVLRLDVDGLRRFARDRLVKAEGTIVAEALAEQGRPIAGTLAMRLFDQKRVTYDLRFDGDDGRSHRLRGQREFFLHDASSITVLGASLYDAADVEIGRAILRFDARSQLGPMLKSFRPRLRWPSLEEPWRKVDV